MKSRRNPTAEGEQARRHPVAVHFTIHEEGESETMLRYVDGSTGPLPPGKTYFDYLPEENKRRFIGALADMLVADIMRFPPTDD